MKDINLKNIKAIKNKNDLFYWMIEDTQTLKHSIDKSKIFMYEDGKVINKYNTNDAVVLKKEDK